MSDVKTRKSVPLEPGDMDRLARLLQGGTPLRRCINSLIGSEKFSDAALMHALVVAGMEHVEELAAEFSYAELAESMDDEDRAYRAALRTRRGRQ